MELKRVVVTGLGALTPIGNNVPALWDSLVKGVSGAVDHNGSETAVESLIFSRR